MNLHEIENIESWDGREEEEGSNNIFRLKVNVLVQRELDKSILRLRDFSCL